MIKPSTAFLALSLSALAGPTAVSARDEAPHAQLTHVIEDCRSKMPDLTLEALPSNPIELAKQVMSWCPSEQQASQKQLEKRVRSLERALNAQLPKGLRVESIDTSIYMGSLGISTKVQDHNCSDVPEFKQAHQSCNLLSIHRATNPTIGSPAYAQISLNPAQDNFVRLLTTLRSLDEASIKTYAERLTQSTALVLDYTEPRDQLLARHEDNIPGKVILGAYHGDLFDYTSYLRNGGFQKELEKIITANPKLPKGLTVEAPNMFNYDGSYVFIFHINGQQYQLTYHVPTTIHGDVNHLGRDLGPTDGAQYTVPTKITLSLEFIENELNRPRTIRELNRLAEK